MRTRILIILSLHLLAFLAPTTLCVSWEDPSTSAEEMLNAGEEEVWTTESEGQAATPSLSREIWLGKAEANTALEDTPLPLAQTEAAIVQGYWYFALNDSVKRELEFDLFQNGDNIYGTGQIYEGNNTLDVAVSGTIADSAWELNVVSLNPIIQYKFNLNLEEDLAYGEYQASSASGEMWTGTAEGEKTS